MTHLIHDQVHAYRDAWKREHNRAVERFDFVDYLDFGLSLLKLIRQIDQRYQERVRKGLISLDKKTFEDIRLLYEDWFAPCESLLKRIDEFVREGFEIENAEEFRAACRSSHVPGLEPEKLNAADARFRAGKGRPLGEVMDEIRHRTGR